ncbi:hypothetical protein [Desulfonatronum parangueonense]
MISRWTLEEVAAWGPRWLDLGRDEDFLQPHPDIWPSEIRLIPELLAQIQACLPPVPRRLFDQACLAALALSPNRTDISALADVCLDSMRNGLPLTRARVVEMSWIRVPTFLADHRRGLLRFVLLGRGQQEHARCSLVKLDSTAARAVRTALELVGTPDVFVWPIVEPGILSPALHGESLALPVALGAWLLRRGRDWPDGLACTGGLSTTGSVLPVDNVFIKAQTAAWRGYTTFFHPPRQQVLLGDGMTAAAAAIATAVEVHTLDVALNLAACFNSDRIPGHDGPLPISA